MQKKKLSFVTRQTYVQDEKHQELNTEESQTVVGQSMTVKELMEKHYKGTLNLKGIHREGYYEDEENEIDYEKLNRMDLTELDEVQEAASAAISRAEEAAKTNADSEEVSSDESKAEVSDEPKIETAESTKDGEKPS